MTWFKPAFLNLPGLQLPEFLREREITFLKVVQVGMCVCVKEIHQFIQDAKLEQFFTNFVFFQSKATFKSHF